LWCSGEHLSFLFSSFLHGTARGTCLSAKRAGSPYKCFSSPSAFSFLSACLLHPFLSLASCVSASAIGAITLVGQASIPTAPGATVAARCATFCCTALLRFCAASALLPFPCRSAVTLPRFLHRLFCSAVDDIRLKRDIFLLVWQRAAVLYDHVVGGGRLERAPSLLSPPGLSSASLSSRVQCAGLGIALCGAVPSAYPYPAPCASYSYSACCMPPCLNILIPGLWYFLPSIRLEVLFCR